MANLAEAVRISIVKHLSPGLLFSITLGCYIDLIPEEVRPGRCQEPLVSSVIQVLELCLKDNPGLSEQVMVREPWRPHRL